MASSVTTNKRALHRLSTGLGALVDDVKDDTLQGTAREARRTVHVISGKTRGSIQVEGDTVTAGYGAIFEEFGTVYRAAHPFMRPAFTKALRPAHDRITDRIKDAVRG